MRPTSELPSDALVPNQVKAHPNATNGKSHHSPSLPPLPDLPSALDMVDPIIYQHYEALVPTVHCCLAVCGAMSIADRTKSLAVILEGRSGIGKTAAAQMLFPADDESPLNQHIYRSDDFSPKAFVSHHANRKRSELGSIDLLPRLANKTLVTKELAPIFRGREQEIQDNFSILISVLDGKGFTSDKGTWGQRGYRDPILFNWIGCTTPFPPRIHHLMSQLGTRFLFWEVNPPETTFDELVGYLANGNDGIAEFESRSIVNAFLSDFYSAAPPASIPVKRIHITPSQTHRIVQWAQFLCAARAEIKSEKTGNETNWTPVAAMASEGPHKVIGYLADLARGHALICGRYTLDDSDMDIVDYAAMSSIPAHLRPALRLMRSQKIDSLDVETLCRVSRPTAISYLKQILMLGLAEQRSDSYLILKYAPRWAWLME